MVLPVSTFQCLRDHRNLGGPFLISGVIGFSNMFIGFLSPEPGIYEDIDAYVIFILGLNKKF
jgi:hypothetical protein